MRQTLFCNQMQLNMIVDNQSTNKIKFNNSTKSANPAVMLCLSFLTLRSPPSILFVLPKTASRLCTYPSTVNCPKRERDPVKTKHSADLFLDFYKEKSYVQYAEILSMK